MSSITEAVRRMRKMKLKSKVPLLCHYLSTVIFPTSELVENKPYFS